MADPSPSTREGKGKEISDLPFRVIKQIFREYADIADDPDQPIPSHPQIPEVCKVCRSWSSAANSTPALWRNIAIDRPLRIPVFSKMVTMSQPLPINLRLDLYYQEWDDRPLDDSHDWPLMRELLEQNLFRCERLLVRYNARATGIPLAIEKLFLEWPVPLSRLEELVIEKFMVSDSEPPLPGPVFPKGLPALKIMKMGTIVALPTDAYKQLTTLHIFVGGMFLEQFYDLLSKCIAVETLAVYGDFNDHAPEVVEEFTSIDLPKMWELRLFDVSEYNVSRILSVIPATQVCHLALSYVSLGNPQTFQMLPGHELRCPNVTKLTLSLGRIAQQARDAVCIAAECFLKVKNVTFVGSSAVDGLEVLCENIGDQIAFPKLLSISLSSAFPLRELIEAREKAGAKLDTVRLSEKAHKNHPDLDWLQNTGRVNIEVHDDWQVIVNEGLLYPSSLYSSD